MRYLIKQRYFTIKDRFTIKDASGADRYVIEGKLISIGKRFSFNTLRGEQIFYVKQRFFTLTPKFQIYQNDNLVATFKSRITLFRPKAKITSSYGEYTMKGDIMAWDFNVENDASGQTAMQISKKILSIADTYTVDINERNEQLMLAIAVIIDLIYQRGH